MDSKKDHCNHFMDGGGKKIVLEKESFRIFLFSVTLAILIILLEKVIYASLWLPAELITKYLRFFLLFIILLLLHLEWSWEFRPVY